MRPIYHSQVHNIINEKIEDDSIPELYRYALITISENLTIKDSNKMTSAAGKASGHRVIRRDGGKFKHVIDPKSLTLTLSNPLMSNATEDQRHNTITHELAHLIDYVIRDGSSHDYAWKCIHQSLGGNGHRCHQIDNSEFARTITRFKIQDSTNGRVLVVTAGNWKKAQSWGTRYRLLEKIQYKGKNVVHRSTVSYSV